MSKKSRMSAIEKVGNTSHEPERVVSSVETGALSVRKQNRCIRNNAWAAIFKSKLRRFENLCNRIGATLSWNKALHQIEKQSKSPIVSVELIDLNNPDAGLKATTHDGKVWKIFGNERWFRKSINAPDVLRVDEQVIMRSG